MLAVADLTLQSAVEKACAAELIEKETIESHGGGVEGANKERVTFPECFRCGKVNHSHRKKKVKTPKLELEKRLKSLTCGHVRFGLPSDICLDIFQLVF